MREVWHIGWQVPAGHQVEKAGGRLSGVSEWALADRVGKELLMGDTSKYTVLNFPNVLCKPPG